MSASSSNPIGKDPPALAEQRGSELNGTHVPPSRLTRRQILALPIIAAAPNMTQAAREAGISESTLHRWRRDEHFLDELNRQSAEIAGHTRHEIKNLITRSLQVLAELMEDPDPIVRLRAARAIASMGLRVADADNGHPVPDR